MADDPTGGGDLTARHISVRHLPGYSPPYRSRIEAVVSLRIVVSLGGMANPAHGPWPMAHVMAD